MQRFLDLLISIIAEHVSGGFSTHHQEHRTVHTASGIVKPILLHAAIVDEMELRSISESQNFSRYADWFGPKRNQTRFPWDN